MNRSPALAAAFAALALAACGGSDKSTPPPPPPPPPVVVTTFQAASTLLGQVDWTSAPATTCDASTLQNPFGPAAWTGSDLLVPDTDHGRLLGFDAIPPAEADAATAPAASFAIGEPPAASPPLLTVCNDATATLGFPQSPAVSGTKLVVSDSGFMQVYVWNSVPSSWSAAPDVTIGDASGLCSGTSLADPRGAIVVGTDLVIADSQHNRVLVYALASPTAPRLVLGQVESADADPFDLCTANDATGTGDPIAPAASTLNYPTAVWSDGTKLAVADTGNHRVLVWNTFPTASGQAADVVIGQANMTASTSGTGAARLSSPESIASDGEQLFVADTGNNRVLVYPSIPTASGASATIVLGQGDFSSNHVAANDDNQDGNPDANPSARTLNGPNGVAVVDGLLAVTDTGNGRVLVYRAP